MNNDHIEIRENEVVISTCHCGKCPAGKKESSSPTEKKGQSTEDYVEVEMRSWKILYVTNPLNIKISPEDMVICNVERGYDIGKVLNTSVKSSEINEQYLTDKSVTLARIANETDLDNLQKLYEKEKNATKQYIETLGKYPFEMKLINTIYQFDCCKVTFFFTADSRIDFREFVRELAHIFKTRIELHQCTSRDEAKKLGGYGMCGNEFCCSSFLKRFNQVTIKMAKDQNLSGNLSKISGPCGRLLCCLHFEEDFYAEQSKDYPEIGDEIVVNGKKMYVFRNDVYSKIVHLTSETQEMSSMPLSEYNKAKRR